MEKFSKDIYRNQIREIIKRASQKKRPPMVERFMNEIRPGVRRG